MDIELQDLDGGIQLVTLRGRLDTRGVDLVENLFSAAVCKTDSRSLVDLSQVEFLASMGIRMLVASARSARGKNARFALYGAQGPVRDVLEHAALGTILPTADDLAGARAALA